jgi:hypothetical protein
LEPLRRTAKPLDQPAQGPPAAPAPGPPGGASRRDQPDSTQRSRQGQGCSPLILTMGLLAIVAILAALVLR